MASLAICFTMLVIFLIGVVQARFITLNASSYHQLATDGVDHVEKQLVHFNSSSSLSSSSDTCDHVYGFLPCAENTWGYLFQVVIYQYLMIVGGQLVADGSKTLFTMLGTGVFGATLFRVLLNFPRISFAIMSGVFSTQEQAQRQVSLSVGIYSGSTLLVLTLLWGIAGVVGRREIPEKPCGEPSTSTPLLDKEHNETQHTDICSELKETGVTTDEKTSYTAGLMLLSLIPFLITELVNIFNTSSGSRLIILIALIVSAASLLSYFIYQLWFPWLQERSLEFSKYEKLVSGFLNYVQRQTKGKLVDANGQPNVPAIESLFSQHDKDADRSLTHQELQKLMDKIQAGEVQVDKEYAVSQVLEVFDVDGDGRISKEEFSKGLKKWIAEAQRLEGQEVDSTTNEAVNKVIQSFTKKRREELSEIEDLMGSIVMRVRSQALEAKRLLNDEGTLNTEFIEGFFKQFGSSDNSISQSELKQAIQTLKFGEGPPVSSDDQTVIKVMRGFDIDGNNVIDEREFVDQANNWLSEAVQVENGEETKQPTTQPGEVNWEEIDKLVYRVQTNGNLRDKLSLAWIYSKPVLRIILGVAMLTLIAKPFMASLVQFTTSIGMDTFFISFILIPIIMNARMILSAIFPASQKCSRTASLTFSEIYGDVIMNNIMGLTTILAIIYAKELPWDYPTEVLIVVLVTLIVGFFAFFCSTYPLWTSLFAFFLCLFFFTLSLVVHYVFGWN